jgi:hypothetical protein
LSDYDIFFWRYLWGYGNVPKITLIIPFLWSLIGFSAATTLGIREDTVLLVASFLANGILLFRKQNLQPARN